MSGPTSATDPMEPFLGQWQRVCTGTSFGAFAPTPDTKSFVVIEPSEGRAVRWSFGSSLSALRVGYTTSLGSRASVGASLTPLIVAHGSGSGWGAVRADGLHNSVCTLTLLSATGMIASVTYRALDADTLAVAVTEVPEKGDAAVLQQGFLFRVLAPQPVVEA